MAFVRANPLARLQRLCGQVVISTGARSTVRIAQAGTVLAAHTTSSRTHTNGGAGSAAIHRSASEGYDSASVAASYERGRPEYTAESLQYVAERLALHRDGIVVVDVGAGTGKFTRLLSKYLTGRNSRIVAVEPVKSMRQQLIKTLTNQASSSASSSSESNESKEPLSEGVFGRIEVRDGSAERMTSIASNSVDAVVAAQAFHWFDGVKARTEMHRILKPSSASSDIESVCLIWNRRDTDTNAIQIGLNSIVQPFEEGTPRYAHGTWKQAWTTEKTGFGPLRLKQFGLKQVGPPAMIVDRTLSVSFMGSLSDAQKEQVRQRIDRLLAEPNVKPHMTRDGQYVLDYVVDVFTTSKKA